MPIAQSKANQVNQASHLDLITLENLQRLLRHPVEVFFRQRLQVEFDQLDDVAQEDEPFALNHLQQYQAGQDLLQAGGHAQALARLHASGSLPLAGFGQQAGADLQRQAQAVLQMQTQWLLRYPQQWPVQAIDLTLPVGDDASDDVGDDVGHGWSAEAAAQTIVLADALRITGTLTGLRGTSDDTSAPCLQLAARTGAVLQGKGKNLTPRGHVLVKLWVNHLAGCASGLNLTSIQIGVDGCVVLRPMAADAARVVLVRLAAAYAQALAAPLPLVCKTAWAYLQAEQANALLLAQDKPPKDPLDAARKAFETQPGTSFPGEWEQSAYLQRAFDSFDDLVVGRQHGLAHWAQVLYGDLLSRVDCGAEVQL